MFNVFILRVVKLELYKDIPFWTVLLGEDFYPNHSFWSENDGMIAIRTSDTFGILNFKIQCIFIKYNKYYKDIELEYIKNYGDAIDITIDEETISGIEYFNRNVQLYYEKTGITIGNEPQDCPISKKFWEYNFFIDKTRSYTHIQMQDVERIYEPTLDDVFKKKLFPQYLYRNQNQPNILDQ